MPQSQSDPLFIRWHWVSTAAGRRRAGLISGKSDLSEIDDRLPF